MDASKPFQRTALKRSRRVTQTPTLPTVASEEAPELVNPVHEINLDFTLVQHRLLESLQKVDGTDDAFFELDDSECSLPSSPTSPLEPHHATPSINVPLAPPNSAPPCPQNGITIDKAEHASVSMCGTPTINQPDDSSLLQTTKFNVNQTINHINSECKLQQSLSTPCNTDEALPVRKESEYRRFKSEGSSAGQTLPATTSTEHHMDELSPVDQRNGSRYPLMPQDSVANPTPITKQSHTEQVAMMHTLKTKLSKYQSFIDRAMDNIMKNTDTDIIEGCTIITKLMKKAWATPKVSVDLSIALCDYLRDREYFDKLIKIFLSATCDPVRLAVGKSIEECISRRNRDFIVNKNYTKRIITILTKMTKTPDQQRLGLSLMEALFEHSNSTSLSLIEFGVLDTVLLTVRTASNSPETLRYAALALANLSLHCCPEGRKKLVLKKIPEWLFMLATQADDITRYYACLATCAVTISHESEINQSTTMKLTDRFVNSHQPDIFAKETFKHLQGRPKEWIKRLLPLLKSSRKEAKTIAAFHLAMEAYIKKEQNKLDIFSEIGAIQALKEVASSPNEAAAKFASEALTVIGEEVPYKLVQQVPSWTADDVQYWVKKIGFEEYVDQFAKQKVDGDLLLHLNENDLDHDIGMHSGLHRKRFLRELESLKIAADYSAVDETNLDQFLMSLSPELSVYTYQMLSNGVNRSLLSSLTDDLMQNACGINNPIHRLKLIKAFENSKHPDDVEVAMLSKQIDVFISYRRSNGNQLASLINVLLQLRGYKVFIDVERLSAGNFDNYLLKNIQAAKHFILVLTPKAFDRLLNDENCEDWIHKELRCAFEHHKNIIPIFDQQFEYPAKETQIPEDIRLITKINGVKWVHDYQDACMAKVVRFIESDINRNTYKYGNNVQKKPAPISKTAWSNNATTRTQSTIRTNSSRMEPSTPTFALPSNSQDKVRRRGIQSSISTVSDRALV